MRNKINIEEIPKKDNFPVPDDYFDQLSDEINKRIRLEKRRTIPVFVRKLAAAASVLLVIGLGFILLSKYSSNSIKLSYAEQYIIENTDTDFLMEYLAENNPSNEPTEESLLIEFDILDESLLIDEL
jgi:hypothetical protein